MKNSAAQCQPAREDFFGPRVVWLVASMLATIVGYAHVDPDWRCAASPLLDRYLETSYSIEPASKTASEHSTITIRSTYSHNLFFATTS